MLEPRTRRASSARALRLSLGIVAVFALSALGAAPADSCTPLPGGPGGQVATPYCGNGRRDPGEQCDDSDLGGKTCKSLDPKFAGGSLRCDWNCLYVTTNCQLPEPPSTCGNGRIDPGEACDGNDLGAVGCERYPGGTGLMHCLPNCQLDARECTSTGEVPLGLFCGDGVLGPGEECDGKAMSVTNCADLYPGTEGKLTCVPGACFPDTIACIENHCGNGIVEPQFDEDCEGAVWGPSCTELGFWTGQQNCEHCRWSSRFCHGCMTGSRGGIICQ